MKPEQLVETLPVAELKSGSTYVFSYDISAISRADMYELLKWLKARKIDATIVGRDGKADAFTVYEVIKEHADAHV